MSDFYQILKREITPVKKTEGIAAPKNDFGEELAAVDKNDKVLPISRNKKTVTKKKRAKTKSSVNKKIIQKIAPEKKSGIESFLSSEILNPIWLTMSETAKLGGIQKRTVKRALRAGFIKFKIVESRYQVDLRSALIYLFSKKKLWNKVKEFGIGQYIEKWIS